MDTQQIKDAVAEALPATIEDLKTLVAIESISASPAHQGKVAESAQADGSIPMIADFQEVFDDAVGLVTAVGDPDSRQHGVDESLHLGDFARAATAEALLLAQA